MNGHKAPAEPLAIVHTKPVGARRSPRLNAMRLTAIAALMLVLPALDVIA